MVGIMTFIIIPTIYLGGALLHHECPKHETQNHIHQYWYDLCNNSGVLALSPLESLRAVNTPHIFEAEIQLC